MGLFSKPKFVGPSAQERTLGRIAVTQGNLHRSMYNPLMAELRGRASVDHSALLRGRSNADVMQSLKGAVHANPEAFVDAGGTGLASALTGASNADTHRRLGQMTSLASLGLGGASAATQGLAAAGNSATQVALSDMQRKTEKYAQNVDMANTIASQAISLGMQASDTFKMQGKDVKAGDEGAKRSFWETWSDPNGGAHGQQSANALRQLLGNYGGQ